MRCSDELRVINKRSLCVSIAEQESQKERDDRAPEI